MSVVFSEAELEKYLQRSGRVSSEYPVVISKFFTNTQEVEMDGVAQKGEIIYDIISEHIRALQKQDT